MNNNTKNTKQTTNRDRDDKFHIKASYYAKAINQGLVECC